MVLDRSSVGVGAGHVMEHPWRHSIANHSWGLGILGAYSHYLLDTEQQREYEVRLRLVQQGTTKPRFHGKTIGGVQQRERIMEALNKRDVERSQFTVQTSATRRVQ